MSNILISLFLSSLIAIMSIQGYLFIKKHVLKIEKELEVIQKADIAAFYLRKDIQSSGYRGCKSRDETLLDINHITALPSSGCNEILSLKNFPNILLNKISFKQIKPNTNILLIKDIPKAIYKLQNPIQNKCDIINLINTNDLHAQDWMMLADCDMVERFAISSIGRNNALYHQLPENKNACLQKTYNTDAIVIAFQWIAYYLAKTKLKDDFYTLYRDNLNGRAEGLISKVEDFKVKLISTDNGKIKGAEINLIFAPTNKKLTLQIALRNAR